MAKRSILGVMTGKLGNMVGQSNSLVSSKDKQVWRVYNGSVKNPKTIRQAAQRSLFVAAKNFQQAFADILDHSWQGVDYGTKSLNHFRSMVLANGGANFPGFFYQPKGAQAFIPQPWPISRGSINLNTAVDFQDEYIMKFKGLRTPEISFVEGARGLLWQAFLEVNPMLQDGDMITVCALVTNDAPLDLKVPCIPVYDRFIVNTSDATVVDTTILYSANNLFKMNIGSDVEPQVLPVEIYGAIENKKLVAAGFIVSRQNGTKDSWLRSKSNMYVDTLANVAAIYGSNEYITACLDSFMSSDVAADSDWYLNQTGENEEEGGSVGPDPTPVQISVENRTAALTPEGSVNAAYVLNGSQSGYLVYGGKYFRLVDTELIAENFATGTDFAESVVRLILTESLEAQIEAVGYSFLFPSEPDEP